MAFYKGQPGLQSAITNWMNCERSSSGSHTQLSHPTKGEYTWAFHDSAEIGPNMLARIAKHTGLKPEDL